MIDFERLKVCFIAGTLGTGGAERQLFHILRTLKQRGASLRVLSLTEGEFWEYPIRELGVDITFVGARGSRLNRLARIVSTLRRSAFDILQSQHFYTNLYAAAASRLIGLRSVGAIRSNGSAEVTANGKILGPLSLRAPNVITANSEAAIRNAISMGVPANRLYMLPNVVDCNEFSPSEKRNRIPRLIAVGRLGPEKRMDRFLRVLALLRKTSQKEFRAAIVGDGPEKRALESQATMLGFSPQTVQFLGSVSDMTSVYRTSDVLVLTSDREGTPNVLLEAMACGLPVVASAVGGVAEVVDHGKTGFVVNPADEDGIADSLRRLVENESLRTTMARYGREYVLAHHSSSRLCDALVRVYGAALA